MQEMFLEYAQHGENTYHNLFPTLPPPMKLHDVCSCERTGLPLWQFHIKDSPSVIESTSPRVEWV